jgi:hypothetical protein
MKRKKNNKTKKNQNKSLLIAGILFATIGLIIFLIGAFLYRQLFFEDLIINLMSIGLIVLLVGILAMAIHYLTKQ